MQLVTPQLCYLLPWCWIPVLLDAVVRVFGMYSASDTKVSTFCYKISSILATIAAAVAAAAINVGAVPNFASSSKLLYLNHNKNAIYFVVPCCQ